MERKINKTFGENTLSRNEKGRFSTETELGLVFWSGIYLCMTDEKEIVGEVSSLSKILYICGYQDFFSTIISSLFVTTLLL
jgi:hypothetical protein